MTDYANKYDGLLDPEIWAFIERTNQYYPPDAVTRSVAEQRKVYNAMCRAFFNGYPSGIGVEDLSAQDDGHQVPVRAYRHNESAGQARVLYVHGGGLVVGGLNSHDDVCAEICARTGFATVSVDYRLAPEFPFSAALDDVQAAYRWLASADNLPIVLCGDSGGANLAAALAHARRGTMPAPAGQVLIYPGLGGVRHGGSYLEHANAPLLTVKELEFYADAIGGGSSDRDCRAFPLLDIDFSSLPATVAFGAECDPLADDAVNYCAHITAAGGQARGVIHKGLVHGHLRARHSSLVARRAFDDIIAAIAELGGGAA